MDKLNTKTRKHRTVVSYGCFVGLFCENSLRSERNHMRINEPPICMYVLSIASEKISVPILTQFQSKSSQSTLGDSSRRCQ